MSTAVLDIVPLRSLVAVATCGGFHRAAAALHLTQSAVSQHIRRLESATGCTLVERDGRSARFSADGQVLLAQARTILAAHDEALRVLGVRATHPTLTVATTEYGADWALPMLAPILREQCPETEVNFRLERSKRVMAAMDNGDVDVAIYHEPLRPTTAIEGPIFAMKWFAATDFVIPDDAPLPLVVFDEPCSTRSVAIETLTVAKRDFRVVVESADLTGVGAAARAGLGVVLLPVIGRTPEGLRPVDALPPATDCVLQIRFADSVPAPVRDATRAALGHAIP